MAQLRAWGTAVLIILALTVDVQAGREVYVLPHNTDTASKNNLFAVMAARPDVETVEPALRVEPRNAGERLRRWVRVTLRDSGAATTFTNSFSHDSRVEIVEPVPVRTTCGMGDLDAIPNDPLASYQWHLATVNAFAAWDHVPDASSVVIAVVDNGVDLAHPDLSQVLWTNEAEANGQPGVDDDHNGYVDDIHGWNAYEWNGNPNAVPGQTGSSHRTHCAGIAAAAHNNGIGVTGMAPGARIMAVRAGTGTQIYSVVDAVIYAADNGADVISMSFAGPSISLFERDVFNYARSQGSLLVAAAGNEGSTNVFYPAGYPGVIGVAATDASDHYASFSNRGWWVDVAAPGVGIMSTVINGYGYLSGTSMAAPLVAGVVALLRAEDSTIGENEVLARLGAGSETIVGSVPLQSPVGRVNAWRVTLADRPTLVYTGVSYDDGNGNGVIEPGESVGMRLMFDLAGAQAHTLSLSLVPLDNSLITSAGETWTDLPQGAVTTNSLNLTVQPSAPRGSSPLAVAIDADGWADTLVVQVPIDPPWRTHHTAGMVASVTDFGAIGYDDYVYNRAQPAGVKLTSQPVGYLFHGSVMVTDGTHVSDCAYGNDLQNRYDFAPTSDGHIERLGAPADQEVFQAAYTDINYANSTQVKVTQTTTSYPDGDNVVFYDLDLQRLASSTIDYTVGVYCDWDIAPVNNDDVRYNADLRLSYMVGTAGAAGVIALGTAPIAGVRAINNEAVIYSNSTDSFTDAEKLSFLEGGVDQSESDTPADWSHLIAVSLPGLNINTHGHARFALVAAETENDLLALAQAAWNLDGGSGPRDALAAQSGMPSTFSFGSAWPNPFNGTTRLALHLPEAGQVTVRVYDLLGREVTHLYRGWSQAGRLPLVWDGTNASGSPVASGAYLVRAVNGRTSTLKKVFLVR